MQLVKTNIIWLGVHPLINLSEMGSPHQLATIVRLDLKVWALRRSDAVHRGERQVFAVVPCTVPFKSHPCQVYVLHQLTNRLDPEYRAYKVDAVIYPYHQSSSSEVRDELDLVRPDSNPNSLVPNPVCST